MNMALVPIPYYFNSHIFILSIDDDTSWNICWNKSSNIWQWSFQTQARFFAQCSAEREGLTTYYFTNKITAYLFLVVITQQGWQVSSFCVLQSVK